jgi:hypothetical protein
MKFKKEFFGMKPAFKLTLVVFVYSFFYLCLIMDLYYT